MAHIASNVSLNPDPNVVIPEVISGVINVLKSASREPSVKRFVYTSSAITTGFPQPNTSYTTTSESWNELASKLAWAPAPYEEERKWIVYAASKTEAERAAWKFVEEEKPAFEFSTVLPSVNFGAPLIKTQSAETLGWIQSLVKGDLETAKRDGMAPCELTPRSLTIVCCIPKPHLLLQIGSWMLAMPHVFTYPHLPTRPCTRSAFSHMHNLSIGVTYSMCSARRTPSVLGRRTFPMSRGI